MKNFTSIGGQVLVMIEKTKVTSKLNNLLTIKLHQQKIPLLIRTILFRHETHEPLVFLGLTKISATDQRHHLDLNLFMVDADFMEVMEFTKFRTLISCPF